MKDEFEQVEMLGFQEKQPRPVEELLQLTQEEVVILANREIFQAPIPGDVFKNRSSLIEEVINADLSLSEETEAVEGRTPLHKAVTTRFSIAYDQYEGLDIHTAEKLTQFDREVIDAVATLAGHMPVMSAASIYRVITGRQSSASVSKADKEKVVQSMKKCRTCFININITDELRDLPLFPDTDKMIFNDALISYAEYRHETPNGTNCYYQLKSVPIVHQYAQALGKISSIPLELLDTPVNKTDVTLAVQSFLLRSIDESKRNQAGLLEIPWETIYEYAQLKNKNRTQASRIRNSVSKMLTYWVEKGYVTNYQLFCQVSNSKNRILKINCT